MPRMPPFRLRDRSNLVRGWSATGKLIFAFTIVLMALVATCALLPTRFGFGG